MNGLTTWQQIIFIAAITYSLLAIAYFSIKYLITIVVWLFNNDFMVIKYIIFEILLFIIMITLLRLPMGELVMPLPIVNIICVLVILISLVWNAVKIGVEINKHENS